VVIRYAKIGYRLAGMAAIVAPLLRESRTWHADQGPQVSELLRPRPAETLDALGYWIDRRRRLPFYRLSDRREAEQMIRVWQERAVHDVPAAPLEALTSGRVIAVGGQVARYHAGRWLTRLSRGVLIAATMLALLIVLAARL
jgi:hypothetical protein